MSHKNERAIYSNSDVRFYGEPAYRQAGNMGQ